MNVGPKNRWKAAKDSYNNLFSFIDIPKENVNMLNGNAADAKKECMRNEEKVKEMG
jgi:glucosamine-6-phosphate deaminase